MSNTLSILSSSEPSGIGLKSYNVSLPMGTLAIGVDNIHHDVFLSPKFVQAARDYLLDLIRQHTSSAHSLGMEPRPTRGLDSAAFRKLLSELLQSATTQAKSHQNIEIDLLFLENYVLLGNYVRDPDRFEAMDALFQEFLREAGITVADDPAHKEAVETHTALRERVQATRNEITNLEEQREATRKPLDRGEGFFNRLLSSDDPADLKASLHDIEGRLKHQELKLEELGPQVEDARQKLDFFRKGKASRLGEYLDEPENAQRLFDPKGGPESAPLRAQLLTRLLDRLEQYEMLLHVLASYEVRPIVDEYCPPLHLQQLRRALVSKDALKQVDQVIKQVPAKKLALRTIEELSG